MKRTLKRWVAKTCISIMRTKYGFDSTTSLRHSTTAVSGKFPCVSRVKKVDYSVSSHSKLDILPAMPLMVTRHESGWVKTRWLGTRFLLTLLVTVFVSSFECYFSEQIVESNIILSYNSFIKMLTTTSHWKLHSIGLDSFFREIQDEKGRADTL